MPHPIPPLSGHARAGARPSTAHRRAAPGAESVLLALALSACAGAPSGAPEAASDAEWRALATPRPTPLQGAARVSLTEVQLAGELGWPSSAPVRAELGVAELAIAGLLARRDVHLVERRRFAAAVEAERSGSRRAPGAPAAGVSPGAEYVATAVFVSVPGAPPSVEIRISRAPTGAAAASARVTPPGADPVSVARAIVAGVVDALAAAGHRPASADPGGPADGTTDRARVSDAALAAFLSGLAAEERWSWEAARRGYQAAAANPGFFEAAAALARAARLRTGGTLGES